MQEAMCSKADGCSNKATEVRFGKPWCYSHAPLYDAVERPKHYANFKVEVIDAIEAWGLGFAEGNVVKYVARAKHKGRELEDLKKARWYLDRAIKNLEHKETP